MNSNMLCKILNCGKNKRSKGYCSKHYQRYRKYGDALFCKYGHGKRCSIINCFNEHHGYGFCTKHYLKYIKYGNPIKGREYNLYLKCQEIKCDKNHKAKGYCRMHYHYNITKTRKYYDNRGVWETQGTLSTFNLPPESRDWVRQSGSKPDDCR